MAKFRIVFMNGEEKTVECEDYETQRRFVVFYVSETLVLDNCNKHRKGEPEFITRRVRRCWLEYNIDHIRLIETIREPKVKEIPRPDAEVEESPLLRPIEEQENLK